MHMHDGVVVVLRRDFDRGVLTAGRRAADEQRHIHRPPFHFAGDEHHLVERRRDETAQPDHVRALVDGSLENPVGRDHHAQVDHVVVVAPQHDPDDVLADVVHVTLDGGEQYLGLGL